MYQSEIARLVLEAAAVIVHVIPGEHTHIGLVVSLTLLCWGIARFYAISKDQSTKTEKKHIG